MATASERLLGYRTDRRTFLAEGLRVLGATALVTAFSSPALIGKETTTDDVLDDIYRRFGIEIPKKPELRYRVNTNPNVLNYQGVDNDGYNAKLTKKEATVVRNALQLIPGAGSLIQLIIPYKYKDGCEPQSENSNSGIKCRKLISGGTYSGYDWPLGRGDLIGTGIQDYWHSHAYEKPDPDRSFPSDKAGFELKLPDGVSMDDPLPKIEPGDIPLNFLSSVATNGVEVNINYEIPYTTHGERLVQAVVHETGHALLDQVLIVQSENFDEYYGRQSFSLINGATLDVHHPLLEAFAKINGWDLVPFSEYYRRFGADSNQVKEYKEKEASGDIHYFWSQNEDVWGPVSSRKIRLTPYASYGPIQEVFCEFWMASILYPQFLTPEERDFFGKIHEGLNRNPDEFIKQIAKDSQFLLA